MEKIKVDQKKCIGCGLCVSLCGDIFELKNGKAEPKEKFDSKNSCLQETIVNCPVHAIKIINSKN